MGLENGFRVQAVEAGDISSLVMARNLETEYYDQGMLLRQSLVNLSKLSQTSRLVAAYENDSNRLIGTAAFPFEYSGANGEVILEFGAWSVDTKWLGSGVGMNLFYAACQLLEETSQHYDQMIALSKSSGAKVFETRGGIKISPWVNKIGLADPCGTCLGKKNKQLLEGVVCCNHVYDVTKMAKGQS